MSEASVRIGRNASYLQQFLKRGVPEQLRESDRARLAELLKIDEQDLRGVSAPLPTRTYRNNNNHVQHNPRNHSAVSNSEQNFLDVRRPPVIMLARDLPVYGSKDNSDGTFVISSRVVDRTSRPDYLANVEDAYAILVSGDSMDPEIKHGSMAIVNPHLPVHNGDTCAFRRKNDDGTETVTIKQLIRSNEKTWFVHQHNPKRDSEMKRSEWTVCHPITASHFRRG